MPICPARIVGGLGTISSQQWCNIMAKEMTFVAAMRDYFNATLSLYTGKAIDQTPSKFLQEMKELTDNDKVWFRDNLPNVGYSIKSA